MCLYEPASLRPGQRCNWGLSCRLCDNSFKKTGVRGVVDGWTASAEGRTALRPAKTVTCRAAATRTHAISGLVIHSNIYPHALQGCFVLDYVQADSRPAGQTGVQPLHSVVDCTASHTRPVHALCLHVPAGSCIVLQRWLLIKHQLLELESGGQVSSITVAAAAAMQVSF